MKVAEIADRPVRVPNPPRFSTVVLDVDSTLVGIEGIDWLAARRGPEVADAVAQLTTAAMDGAIPLDAVYGERLDLVRPSRADVEALADAYAAAVAPGAPRALAALMARGVRIVLVSGGIRDAIVPVALSLGIPEESVHAVDLQYGPHGEYAGYDRSSVLTTSTGKHEIVDWLDFPAGVLAVGDGVTDLAMRPPADAFAAFTGFVWRENVVARANAVLRSFDVLVDLMLNT